MTPVSENLAFLLLAIAIWIHASQSPQGPPQTASSLNTESSTTEAAPPSHSDSNTIPSMIVLREGTPIKLKLLHTLNSKTVVVDDPLNFSVAEDVVADGNVVIVAGAPATGRVLRTKPARTFGRGAELRLHLDHVRAGKVQVPLRGSLAREGKDKTGETVALVLVFGLSGLVKHGAEVEVKEGASFDAFVDEDTVVSATPHSISGQYR